MVVVAPSDVVVWVFDAMSCTLPEQADLAGRARSKAEEIGGSVRVISRSGRGQVTAEVSDVLRDMENISAASAEEIMESLSGFVQA